MKTLTKLALVILALTIATAARADWVKGHFRGNGTYVSPHYRTPANGIVYDNLSYRGYPSQQPGYVSPRAWSLHSDLSRPKTMPFYGSSRFDTGLLPYTGNSSLKQLYGRSRSSDFDF